MYEKLNMQVRCFIIFIVYKTRYGLMLAQQSFFCSSFISRNQKLVIESIECWWCKSLWETVNNLFYLLPKSALVLLTNFCFCKHFYCAFVSTLGSVHLNLKWAVDMPVDLITTDLYLVTCCHFQPRLMKSQCWEMTLCINSEDFVRHSLSFLSEC